MAIPLSGMAHTDFAARLAIILSLRTEGKVPAPREIENGASTNDADHVARTPNANSMAWLGKSPKICFGDFKRLSLNFN
jgi:hypothetical protein